MLSSKAESLLNNIMKKLALIVFATLSALFAHADDTLFTATYEGRHTGVKITLTRTLEQRSQESFVLHSKASSFLGSISETSDFMLVNRNIIPQQYDYERKVFGAKSLQSLHFDWTNMQANFRRKDKAEKNKDYALVPGALDPSLYQLKLQQELHAGKQKFAFDFAKGGRMKKLEFELSQQKTIYTLAGRDFEAVQVFRVNQPDEKETDIILIPALNYQIAKIVHTEEDGSKYQLKLVSFESAPKKLSTFYKSIDPNTHSQMGKNDES